MSSKKEGTTGEWSNALVGNNGQVEGLHTGKWTKEEEAYVEGLIDEFQDGFLALPDGTSLRQFLARLLHCNPKRISKKFEGSNYAKGRKFYLKSTEILEPEDAAKRRKKLNSLERTYKAKLNELKMPHLLSADRTNDSSADGGGDESRDGIAASLITDSAIAYSTSTSPTTTTAATGLSLPASQGTSLPPLSRMDAHLSLNQSGLTAAGLSNIHGASDTLAASSALLSLVGDTAGNTTGHEADPSLSLNSRLLAQIQAQQTGTRHLSNSLGDLQRRLGANLSSSLPPGGELYSGNLSALQQLFLQSSQRTLDLSSLLGDSQASQRERILNTHLGNGFLNNPASEASLLANDLHGIRRDSLFSSLMSLNNPSSVSLLQQNTNNTDISLQLQRLLQSRSGLAREQQSSTAAPLAPNFSMLQESIQQRRSSLLSESNSPLQSNPEVQNLLQQQLQLIAQQQGQGSPQNRGQKRKAEGEGNRGDGKVPGRGGSG